jgi:dTDP-glucose pyrophosphorylase
MIAVILLPSPSSEMHGLDMRQSLSLLPLGDRSVLQHIIESLVAQGITSIELMTGHAPERVEALFGNGDRWGCSFRYHLVAQHDRPYRSLKIIAKTKVEPWILIHAERYPCLDFPSTPIAKTILYYRSAGRGLNESVESGTVGDRWGGTAIFPAGKLSETLWNKTPDELRGYLMQMNSSAELTVIETSEWIDASTPEKLLDTQARLLGKKLHGLMISGIEREPEVWISRNVVIHPTVELIAPLYIGPNSRLNSGVKLGPCTVISGDCIVDRNTTIEHSLITAGSYIGEGLELSKTVVNHNLLVNVRLDTKVDILESFLLGGLEQPLGRSWFGRGIQSLLAFLLIVLFLPVSLFSFIYFTIVRRFSYTSVEMAKLPADQSRRSFPKFSLPCLGADAWEIHRPAGWDAFLRQFLPGLVAVLLGDIDFVGLPPKSTEKIQQLPLEWRALYQEGKAGLITEAGISAADAKDETQLYLADAYYTARQNPLHDIRLASQYIFRLITPRLNHVRNIAKPREN